MLWSARESGFHFYGSAQIYSAAALGVDFFFARAILHFALWLSSTDEYHFEDEPYLDDFYW